MTEAMSQAEGSGAPVRVLHVFRYFQPDFTGEGLYFAKLAPHLAALGVQCDVAVAARDSAPTVPPPAGVGAVHRLVDEATQAHAWGNRRLLAWLMANARCYHAVHFHSLVDRLFLPQLLARLSFCRVVQSATLDDGLGMIVDSYKPHGRFFVRRFCRLIDRAVTISPRLYDDSLRVLPRDRVSLIPQGVNRRVFAVAPEVRAAARAAFGLAPDDVVLLFVGGLCERKDVAFLLDAMPAAPAGGKRLRLLVVGPDLERDYARRLRDRAPALGQGTVIFTGYLADPAQAYAAADAFVFASRDEGFGNVLIEAMAAGLPVVARHLPGVTDSFIRDGETGFLFSDAASYDSIVRRLVDDRGLRERVGRAACDASADYDLEAVAARYADVYRGVLETGGVDQPSVPVVGSAADRPQAAALDVGLVRRNRSVP